MSPATLELPPTVARLCASCGESIPAARLQATGHTATLCVPCLEQQGDVPVLRRLDEYLPDGDKVETLFTENSSFDRYMRHMSQDVAPVENFAQAVGDDSHMFADKRRATIAGYGLETVFEDCQWPERTEGHREGISLGLLLFNAAKRVEEGTPREGDVQLLADNVDADAMEFTEEQELLEAA